MTFHAELKDDADDTHFGANADIFQDDNCDQPRISLNATNMERIVSRQDKQEVGDIHSLADLHGFGTEN